MPAHTPQVTGPQRTLELLEEIASGQRGEQLRAQVAAASRGSTPEQVEEAFQEACLRATRNCRGQTMGEVYVWLRKTTGTLLRDALDRVRREVLVDHGAREFRTEDINAARPDDVVIKREERAELDALTMAILDRLCERERAIAILHSHGYARKEIAQRLGLTPRVVKRSVEEVLATGRSQLAKFTGYGCADGHQLVSRYAFGLAAGGEARRAQLHLTTCERCGSMYERLDVWRERVAVLLPVPPVAVEQHQTIERAVQAGADAVGSSHGPTGTRRHVGDLFGHLRDHLAGASMRAADPTPLAGLRPGTLAAAVAGCIAIGGGATYCVKQNAGQLIGLPDRQPAAQARHERSASQQTSLRTTRTTALASWTAAQTTSTPATPTPTSTAASTTSEKKTTKKHKALAPANEDEFEPTSPEATGASATPTASAASAGAAGASVASAPAPKPKPKPAPAASQAGEFDGP